MSAINHDGIQIQSSVLRIQVTQEMLENLSPPKDANFPHLFNNSYKVIRTNKSNTLIQGDVFIKGLEKDLVLIDFLQKQIFEKYSKYKSLPLDAQTCVDYLQGHRLVIQEIIQTIKE
jgi:hypothetical protein